MSDPTLSPSAGNVPHASSLLDGHDGSVAPRAPAAEGAPKPRSRRSLWVALVGAAAAVAVGAFVAARHEHGPPPAAAITSDVPRAEGKAIIFSQNFRERAGLITAPARRATLAPTVRVVGTVDFDPEHVAAVGTRIRGLVRRLAKLEGDRVKKGELLAEIESAELGEAQASVAMVGAQKKAAELNATRERDLSARKLSTAREAEVAEASLDEYRAMLAAAQQKVTALGGGTAGPFGVYMLRAPLDGTVVDRHILSGQSVEGNLVAYRIANLDHVWIELDVFERSLGHIRKGDAVEVRPTASPDTPIMGRVAYVGDAIDLSTRSARVRVKVDNAEHALRPGQSVTAIIRYEGREEAALLVPRQAIAFVDGKPTVFVLVAPDRAVVTEVTLGPADEEAQAVTSGIEEGAAVVTSGVFALKSELFR
jgi:membrane fusion protein, heavy metal efflux system